LRIWRPKSMAELRFDTLWICELLCDCVQAHDGDIANWLISGGSPIGRFAILAVQSGCWPAASAPTLALMHPHRPQCGYAGCAYAGKSEWVRWRRPHIVGCPDILRCPRLAPMWARRVGPLYPHIGPPMSVRCQRTNMFQLTPHRLPRVYLSPCPPAAQSGYTASVPALAGAIGGCPDIPLPTMWGVPTGDPASRTLQASPPLTSRRRHRPIYAHLGRCGCIMASVGTLAAGHHRVWTTQMANLPVGDPPEIIHLVASPV
jgi:hypothetical protein